MANIISDETSEEIFRETCLFPRDMNRLEP